MNISAKFGSNLFVVSEKKMKMWNSDLKSNMAARVHNVFSLAEILKIFLSETTKSIEL
jgi:hypothetical protein